MVHIAVYTVLSWVGSDVVRAISLWFRMKRCTVHMDIAVTFTNCSLRLREISWLSSNFRSNCIHIKHKITPVSEFAILPRNNMYTLMHGHHWQSNQWTVASSPSYEKQRSCIPANRHNSVCNVCVRVCVYACVVSTCERGYGTQLSAIILSRATLELWYHEKVHWFHSDGKQTPHCVNDDHFQICD